jgi:hypothetical protein
VPVEHEEFEGGHRGTAWRYALTLPRLVGALVRERGDGPTPKVFE